MEMYEQLSHEKRMQYFQNTTIVLPEQKTPSLRFYPDLAGVDVAKYTKSQYPRGVTTGSSGSACNSAPGWAADTPDKDAIAVIDFPVGDYLVTN